MITQGSILWQYLSPDQRALADDGAALVSNAETYPPGMIKDFSYLVFPFAKLYEGFLKQVFLDLGCITQREYTSDHFRIGKSLSPNLVRRLRGRSAYGQIERKFGEDLALHLWKTWKNGRNMIFHYFPHNYRALDFQQAKSVIHTIVDTMNHTMEHTGVHPRQSHG